MLSLLLFLPSRDDRLLALTRECLVRLPRIAPRGEKGSLKRRQVWSELVRGLVADVHAFWQYGCNIVNVDHSTVCQVPLLLLDYVSN